MDQQRPESCDMNQLTWRGDGNSSAASIKHSLARNYQACEKIGDRREKNELTLWIRPGDCSFWTEANHSFLNHQISKTFSKSLWLGNIPQGANSAICWKFLSCCAASCVRKANFSTRFALAIASSSACFWAEMSVLQMSETGAKDASKLLTCSPW